MKDALHKSALRILTRPLMEVGSIDIQVQRIFTDVNGTIYDKNDAAIPAALKTEYPVYLFGEYDRKGGYLEAQKALPPRNGYKFLYTFVWGVGSNPYFFGFNPLSNIQTVIKPGDICTVWVDDPVVPSWFIWVVLSTDQTALSSIIQNATIENDLNGWGKINIDSLRYYSDNPKQWREQFQNLILDRMSDLSGDHSTPQIYRQPKTINNEFAFMEIQFVLTQYAGIQFYYRFDTNSIQLTFKVLYQ